MKESFSIPEGTKGEYSTRPIDTTTQGVNVVGTLEDMMSFAALKGKEAKHLHETATYLAAKQQVGDAGEIKLAEITYETLKENLRVVLEDCGECGLDTGLECITDAPIIVETNQLVETTFTWMKQLLTENFAGLNTLHKRNSSLVKHYYDDSEALKERVLATNKEPIAGFQIHVNSISGILLKACDCQYINHLSIKNTTLVFEAVLDNILTKVFSGGLAISEEAVNAFKAKIVEKLAIEALEESNTSIVARLPGGHHVEMTDSDTVPNKVFRVMPNSSFGPLQESTPYSTPVVGHDTLVQWTCDYQNLIRVYDKCVENLATQLYRQGEQYSIILTLIDGTWHESQFDTQVYQSLCEELANAQRNIHDIITFTYQLTECLDKACMSTSNLINECLEHR